MFCSRKKWTVCTSNNATAYINSTSNRPLCEGVVICFIIVVDINLIVSTEKQRWKLHTLTGFILTAKRLTPGVMDAHDVIFLFIVVSSSFITLNGDDSLQNSDPTKVYNYPVTTNDQGVIQYFQSQDEGCQPGQTKTGPQFSNPKQNAEGIIIIGGQQQQKIKQLEQPQQQGPNLSPVSPSSYDDNFCTDYGKSVCISLSHFQSLSLLSEGL